MVPTGGWLAAGLTLPAARLSRLDSVQILLASSVEIYMNEYIKSQAGWDWMHQNQNIYFYWVWSVLALHIKERS